MKEEANINVKGVLNKIRVTDWAVPFAVSGQIKSGSCHDGMMMILVHSKVDISLLSLLTSRVFSAT